MRCVLPRGEEWVTNNRHPALLRVTLGARATGRSSRSASTSWIDTGAYADCGPGVAVKIGYSAVGPYRIPNVVVESRCVYTNLPPNGAFRGFGATQAVWASERSMDLLADRLGIDPLELRLRNVLRDGDTFCTGETMHDVHFADCLERAAAAVGWREGRRGKGLCVLLKGMQTPSRASIAIEAGRGRRLHPALRHGRDGPGRAAGALASSRRSCSASLPTRSASPTRTPTSSPTTRARRRAARPT